MSDKEDLEKNIDFVSEQERDYAINALNEFNKYCFVTQIGFYLIYYLTGVILRQACKI